MLMSFQNLREVLLCMMPSGDIGVRLIDSYITNRIGANNDEDVQKKGPSFLIDTNDSEDRPLNDSDKEDEQTPFSDGKIDFSAKSSSNTFAFDRPTEKQPGSNVRTKEFSIFERLREDEADKVDGDWQEDATLAIA